ncbi:hypothetical protein BLX24_13785 [Arsenicibacter rosenii]|uniref:Uncharacterized protein n=1 Tax=Arsenicibacter rosenii TaxID=1750698 RepID=A0A1S2VIU4_9BACT|nr:hypothetical protein BLX24_13785 [Arsenicibacter rosenii]
MITKYISIEFSKSISEDDLNNFKDTLHLYDLDFNGNIIKNNLRGTLISTGMFNLIKGPLIKSLTQSGLNYIVKNITIDNT